jgi:hypothetical protein
LGAQGERYDLKGFRVVLLLCGTNPVRHSGQVWYLTWGVPIGISNGSCYFRLYSFDNFQVKTIWQRGPLPYRKVTVKPDSVALQYEGETLPDGSAHQVLHGTPNVLE